MMSGLLSIIGLGILVGFRHAFEPDHLAAVTTLSTQGRGLGVAARLGVAWGGGHTLSILLVAIVLMVLGIKVPEAFYHTAELGVAALLILLGLATLRAERRHWLAAAPGGSTRGAGAGEALARQATANESAHAHPHAPRSGWRAFGFGVAHGLAGSGAVIVLLVATATTRESQFGYLLAFGVGSVLGMSVVSVITGAISGAAASRSTRWLAGVRVTAALVSTTAGMLLGWRVLSGG